VNTLLIVDDNQQNLYLLQVLLSAKGFQVDLASNGAEALEKARRAPPDMIITDILMPVMDGFSLCRIWKEDERLKNIPFVFYTATYTDPKDEEFALSLGADRFIIKPVEPDKFLDLLWETWNNYRAGKPVVPPQSVEEAEYYKEYNAVLIRKLEDKMLQLEEKNRMLEHDIVERIRAEEERRRLEEQLHQAQRLESVGTLAGGIAHDFNNLLQGIFGYIAMARLDLDKTGKAYALLEKAEEALTRSVSLTTQLLTFAKGGKPVKKLIKLRPLIETSVNLALSGSSVDCVMNIADDLWLVEADERQITQVIQNIVMNAMDAMPTGGTVIISAVNEVIPKGLKPSLPAGGCFVRIAIQDSGIGIPEQYMSRIFDPYFTTKQRGSGLGLASSYSIVNNHEGSIEATSEANKGSTFVIYLPGAKSTVAEEAAKEAPSTTCVPMKRAKVLVMDDEEIVQSVAKEMLLALGHEVECTADGNEAIEAFKAAMEAGRPFDITILDLTVKRGMGGEETLRKLKEIDPDAKVIVSSGYSDDPVISDYRSYGFAAFLNKPYRTKELRDTLQALI
jgi:signal transduction histidine kinase